MAVWFLSSLGLAFVWLYDLIHSAEYTICSPESNIYTVEDVLPRAKCITISGSLITAVGDTPPARPGVWSLLEPYLPAPKVITLPAGSALVPGLADAHAHIIENGFKMQLQLEHAKSVDEVLELLKAYVRAHPDIESDHTRWIEGLGWDQTKWPGAQFPSAADFEQDPVLVGRPIALRRVDVHAMWVSQRVLELTGPLPESVEGGIIIRDADNKPTGVFVDNAMDLIPLPKRSDEVVKEYFETTMREALKYGLTSVHDADSNPSDIEFYKRQAEDGNLPIRLYLMGNVQSEEYWGSKIQRLVNYGKDGRLNVRSVKLFTDGALGSWGAALLEPYSDKPDTTGIMRSSAKVLASLISQFQKDGWQTNVHCIGDKANHVVLDIYDDIITGRNESEAVNVEAWRPRIEHAQIMTPEDLARMARLGVIASVQPTHATSDMWYAETRLGSSRIKGAYAYQTLLQASPHNVLPLGSDFPVEGVNPLVGFYAAVSRLSVDGTSPHGQTGWYSNERLSRAQALKGMTLDAAYASFMEHEIGSLRIGKKADFVVLDKDIMSIEFGEILSTKVLATVVDGRLAYGALP
ncbi:hypothetical protein CYLTODRAFT_394012 [Cylindrobasidium torrendii FP15055 ss-10]|uniref:Amidohydrolase 3 domain-containing protein n=1 Tax=Cylindrobasidium torrendii FP15055 ss-10 TaxID=1314674 RepID=A0A0D7BFF7_9AGAR|nr:hypothetical protein CYLTODRAFT_394012 [Cylindrobasidium torrendii FP15055 ss-10]